MQILDARSLLRKCMVWKQIFIRAKQMIYMASDSLNGVLNF